MKIYIDEDEWYPHYGADIHKWGSFVVEVEVPASFWNEYCEIKEKYYSMQNRLDTMQNQKRYIA